MSNKNLPAIGVSQEGAIMVSAGKYARSAVLAVFEQLGGVEGMTKWAKKNQTDFYTKIFTKTITKEVEDTRAGRTVEDLLDVIDAESTEVANAVDAEFEDV